MRILHIVHQYLPQSVGGTELYTQALARAQVAQGQQVAIFFPSSRLEESEEDILPTRDAAGVRLYELPLGSRSRAGVFWSTFRQRAIGRAFSQVLAQEKPDLIHVQHLMGLPASLIDQIVEARIPFLVTLHDYWYPCANAQLITNYDQSLCSGPNMWVNCGRCILARAGRDSRLVAPALAPLLAYRSHRLRRVLAQAAYVIAPSNFVNETYRELGMPAERMIVIPHGIETPSGDSLAIRDSRDSNTLHIVFVGSVAWQKGVHVLIEAVNGMPIDSVQLTIYGNLDVFPDYVADLQAGVRRSGIYFAGQIERDVLWSRLAEADFLAVPSLWHETSSLVAQEAFAVGLPVVASDLGALRERVQHDRNGLLVPAGDVVAWRDSFNRLRDEPALLARLREGIRPVRTIAEHLADLDIIYQEVAGGNRP